MSKNRGKGKKKNSNAKVSAQNKQIVKDDKTMKSSSKSDVSNENEKKVVRKEITSPKKEEIKPELVRSEDIATKEIDKQKSLKKKRKKKIIFGLVLILSIVFIILSINAMGLFVRKQSEIEMPLVYMTNGELKFISSRKKDSTFVGNYSASNLGIIKYPNRSDKYFLYSQNGELYLAYVRSNKSTIKIADNVKTYYFSANDKHIVYVDKDGKLFVNDFKKNEQLDTDVALVVEVTEDRVYYKKDDNLYSKSFYANKDDKIKIATDYYTVTLNSDCSKILYSKKIGEDLYEYHVYNIKRKKDQKVLSDVYDIYDFNDDFTEFIYGTLNSEAYIDLNNFLDDDKKESDQDFKSYTFDDYWNSRIDYETYKQSQKDSSNVEKRNKIRSDLSDSTKKRLEGSENVDVYYQKGNKQMKLADAVSKIIFTDLKNKRLIYSKDDYSSIEKLKISEIDSISDIKDHVVKDLKNVIFYKYASSDECEITSGKSVVTSSIYGDEIYTEADGEILYTEISKNKLGEIKSIAKNSKVVDWENMYDDGLVFASNVKDDVGDISFVKDGKVTSIDKNVYEKDLVITGDKVYYFKDYNNRNGNYYLYNGRSKRIMSDVGRVHYVKDNYMYVLKDYSSKTSNYDLYKYKGKKLELIDYDVEFVDMD